MDGSLSKLCRQCLCFSGLLVVSFVRLVQAVFVSPRAADVVRVVRVGEESGTCRLQGLMEDDDGEFFQQCLCC